MCVSIHFGCRRDDFPDTCLRTWGFTLYLCHNCNSCGLPEFRAYASICPPCRAHLQLQIANTLIQLPPAIGAPWDEYNQRLLDQYLAAGRLLGLTPADASVWQMLTVLSSVRARFVAQTHESVAGLVNAAAAVPSLPDPTFYQRAVDLTPIMFPTTRPPAPAAAPFGQREESTSHQADATVAEEVAPASQPENLPGVPRIVIERCEGESQGTAHELEG